MEATLPENCEMLTAFCEQRLEAKTEAPLLPVATAAKKAFPNGFQSSHAG